MSANAVQEIKPVDPLAGPRRQAIRDIFGDKFSETFMGPIMFLDAATLHSPTAINFYKRDFAYVSKVLNYEYQYRSWNGYDQDLLNRYAEIITKRQGSIRTLIENWCNRFQKLMSQNNASMESTLYSGAMVATVPIITSHARGYFQILQELDRLNLLAGTANLMGVIDSTQRAEAELICKKAVRAFGAVLRNEVVRIYREADRLIREQHSQGSTDSAKSEAIAAQGKELDEFGAVISSDGKTDRGLDLGTGDPGEMLDEAAAAIKATKATKPKPKAEPVPEPTASV